MQRLNEDLKSGQFKQAYLLYGEEAYLRKQYRDRLKEALLGDGDAMNLNCFEGKDVNVGEVIDVAETLPFFAERRVIVMENTGLFKSGGEKMAEYLAGMKEGNPSQTYFVFCESEVDKRGRLFKQVQQSGYAAELKQQDEQTLKRWAAGILKQNGKKITENTLTYFLEKVGTDMENIRTELEKLICYCMEKEVVEKEDVDSICVVNITNHIFDMVTAISEKQTKKALLLYYDLLQLKEPPMRILFLIARQMNLLLQVKQLKGKGYDNKSIGEKVGLPPFIAGKNVTQASRFKERDLREAVVKCVEAEEAVKTGRLKDTVSVEMLILSVV